LPWGREITLWYVSVGWRRLVLLTVITGPLRNMGIVNRIKMGLYFCSTPRIEVSEVEMDLI
jgi:hypothetical protein